MLNWLELDTVGREILSEVDILVVLVGNVLDADELDVLWLLIRQVESEHSVHFICLPGILNAKQMSDAHSVCCCFVF